MVEHIQIKGIIPRIQYVADGTTSEFEFPFAIFKPENLSVYLNNTLQDISTYQIEETGKTDGGKVIFKTPPASSIQVTLCRNLKIERLSDFQEGVSLRANVLNDELDYQTACIQEIAENLNRSMVLPPYVANTNLDLTLPYPEAGKAIVWNTSGTNLENSNIEINALEETIRNYKEIAQERSQIATTAAQTASNAAQTVTTASAKIEQIKENLDTRPYIVESYRENTNWYRVWSNGFIEQGGVTYVNGSSAGNHNSQTITFLKPFSSTSFLPIITMHETSTDNNTMWAQGNWKTRSKTATSFVIERYQNEGTGGIMHFNWMAFGH